MTKPRKKLAICACAAALSTIASQGQSVLTEDFESLTDGDQLLSELGTVQSLGQQTGSTLTGQAYGLSAPINGFGGGDIALYFNDSVTTGDQLLLVGDEDFDLADAYDPTQTTTLSFDYYYESSDGSSNPTMNMQLFITDGEVGIRDGLNLQLYSNLRQVRYAPGGGGSYFVLNGGAQLKVDTWYRFQVKIHPLDTASDTFDLTVIEDTGGFGTTVFEATDLDFASDISDIAVIQFQGFASGASTHQAYFDNIDWIEGEIVPPPISYVEDFEDNKNGGAVSDMQIVYQLFSDWGGTGNTETQNLTVTTEAPSNPFTPTSGHALFYNDQDSAANGSVRLQMQSNDNSVGPLAETPTTLTFDFYNVDNATQNLRLLVGDSDSLNTLNLEIFRGDNVGQIFNGGDFIPATDGGNNWLNQNTWYRYALIIDSQTDTYDLTIYEAGNPTARYDVGDLPIKNSGGVAQDLATITRIEFTTFENTAGGIGYQAYFDNVGISQNSSSEPSPLEIVAIDYDATANTVTLTWTSEPGGTYAVNYSTDLTAWSGELGTGLTDADDEVGGDGDQITVNFDLAETPIETAEKAFFRVEN